MIKKHWQILLAALLFLFSSCDQLLPPSGTGKLVQVKIRAVSIAGGAQNKTLTRAGGGASRIVSEPIVRDLGGGMFAGIAVEEDLSALRADLGNNVKFRVIAVSSDDKVYSYADYTTGSAITQVDGSPELHVETGKSYYFVCISYNNTTLPDPPEPGDDPTVEVTAGSNDLLYQKFTPAEAIPTSGEVNLSFTNLTHQLAKVQLTLKVAADKTITNIDNSKVSLDAPSSGSFNLKKEEGEFSSLSGNTVFTWPSTAPNADTAESNPITFIPKAAEIYTLSWPANAVTVADGAIQRFLAAGSVTILHSKFAAGGSYTIGLKLYRVPRFAGSNIYWDETNSRLTFDDHGDYVHTKYQGVYFKWGSLIGVSPVGAYSSSSTILYKPKDIATRTWERTTGSACGWSNWDAIPYFSATSAYGTAEHTLVKNPDFTHYKGDICNYINPAYRMPTANEFGMLKYYTKVGGPGYSVSGDEAEAGRYVVTRDQSGIFLATYGWCILPASEWRDSSGGTLNTHTGRVGEVGYYWSGSAYSSSDAYLLAFGIYKSDNMNLSRSYGQSVRCVLQK